MYRMTFFLVGILMFGMTGCASIKGIHLHSEADAKKAKSAVEDYEKIDLNSIIETGLKNKEALTEKELKTHKETNEVAFKIDLVNIIGVEPRKGDPANGILAFGWTKLVEDTEEALKPYDFSGIDLNSIYEEDGKLKESVNKVMGERAVEFLEANKKDLDHSTKIYDGAVQRYKKRGGEGETDCQKVPRSDDELTTKLNELNEVNKTPESSYRLIFNSCKEIRELKSLVKLGEAVIKSYKDYLKITEKINGIKENINARKQQIKIFLIPFKKSEQRLAKLEKELEKAKEDAVKPEQPTGKEKKDSQKGQDISQKQTLNCDELIKEPQSGPSESKEGKEGKPAKPQETGGEKNPIINECIDQPDKIACWENKIREELNKIQCHVSEGLKEGLKIAKQVPLFGEEFREIIQTDAIANVLQRFDKLATNRESQSGQIASRFLNILLDNPEIKKGLGFKVNPTKNELVLALSLHRMKYQIAVAQQNYDKSRLILLEAKRKTYERELEGWLETKSAIDLKRISEEKAVNDDEELDTLRKLSDEEPNKFIKLSLDKFRELSDEELNTLRKLSYKEPDKFRKLSLNKFGELSDEELNKLRKLSDEVPDKFRKLSLGKFRKLFLDNLRKLTIEDYFLNKKVNSQMKSNVIRALIGYGVAKTAGEGRRSELDVEIRSLMRSRGLESSQIALTAWNDVIKAPIQEIALYHEGGITSEQISDLVNAIFLGFIAGDQIND